jgi:hypothetical protein
LVTLLKMLVADIGRLLKYLLVGFGRVADDGQFTSLYSELFIADVAQDETWTSR